MSTNNCHENSTAVCFEMKNSVSNGLDNLVIK